MMSQGHEIFVPANAYDSYFFYLFFFMYLHVFHYVLLFLFILVRSDIIEQKKFRNFHG